jgi:DNA integrity scanning protein DisA with diadenylate cyclase activity
MKEILHGVEKELNNTIKDYTRLNLKKTRTLLDTLSYDGLLETENIKKALGILDDQMILEPRGHRFLSQAGLLEEEIGLLIKEFKRIQPILDCRIQDLERIFQPDAAELIASKIERQMKTSRG